LQVAITVAPPVLTDCHAVAPVDPDAVEKVRGSIGADIVANPVLRCLRRFLDLVLIVQDLGYHQREKLDV